MTTTLGVETTAPGSNSGEDEYVPSLEEWQECCNDTIRNQSFQCQMISLTAFSSCTHLLDNITIEVIVWIVGLLSFIGNGIVLIFQSWTFCSKDSSRLTRTNALLILSLASADILNGVYLLIIAGVDAKFGDDYYFYAEEWLESPLCQATGFIATLSGQMSVFMLTIISIERMIVILFPFKMHLHMGIRTTGTIILLIWTISLIICTIPFMFPESFTGFYGNSDVCIGLPVGLYIYAVPGGGESGELEIEGSSWKFGIAIYVGIQLICLAIILFCYVIIFFTVRRTGREARSSQDNHHQEIQMATKMAVIVCTDFVAWFPIVIMFILVIVRVWSMPATLYAYIVALLLPINSALNPYIYTITAVHSKRISQKGKDSKMKGSNATNNSGISLDKMT